MRKERMKLNRTEEIKRRAGQNGSAVGGDGDGDSYRALRAMYERLLRLQSVDQPFPESDGPRDSLVS